MRGQLAYPYRVCRFFNVNQGVHMQLSGRPVRKPVRYQSEQKRVIWNFIVYVYPTIVFLLFRHNVESLSAQKDTWELHLTVEKGIISTVDQVKQITRSHGKLVQSPEFLDKYKSSGCGRANVGSNTVGMGK